MSISAWLGSKFGQGQEGALQYSYYNNLQSLQHFLFQSCQHNFLVIDGIKYAFGLSRISSRNI